MHKHDTRIAKLLSVRPCTRSRRHVDGEDTAIRTADNGGTRKRQFSSTTWPFSIKARVQSPLDGLSQGIRRSEPVKGFMLTASRVNPNCVDKLSAVIAR